MGDDEIFDSSYVTGQSSSAQPGKEPEVNAASEQPITNFAIYGTNKPKRITIKVSINANTSKEKDGQPD